MNTMLGVLLASAIFVTFCDAQCTFSPLEIVLGSQPSGCKDVRGTFHEFNTQWEFDCTHCSCEVRVGLSCCNMVMRPKSYDKENCIEIFQKESCIYVPVKKANPTERCEVSQYIG